METHLRTELVLAALNMAVAQRRPTDVIHHSDQGCQYRSVAFGKRCAEAGVRPSMGSVGDAYDNALCESFFATLECELLNRHRFRTQVEARLAVFDFIEGWYNPRRRHSALDYRSPMFFERTSSTGDRTVPAGSTIDQGAAISLSPQRRCGEPSRKQFTVYRTGATPGPSGL
jgi:putative transposase